MANSQVDFGQKLQNAFMQAITKIGSWLEILRLKIVDLLQKLELTPVRIIEICSYLGIGFFVGFLLKKYFRIVILFSIAYIVLIWVLGEFDLVLINWSHVQSLAHVTPEDTIGSILASSVKWIKQNLAIVVSGSFGFLVGYKVG